MKKTKTPPKYPNLAAEMSRSGIGIPELCEATGRSKSSVYDYINGKENRCFTIDDAFAIQRAYFPALTVSYLFDDRQQTIAAPVTTAV